MKEVREKNKIEQEESKVKMDDKEKPLKGGSRR